MQFSEVSKLSFFTAVHGNYKNEHICDFLSRPRLHFYIAMPLEGAVDFRSGDGETVSVNPGELIFVPIMANYISCWHGNPKISFISIQFAFEPFCGISEQENYHLQKILPDKPDELKEKFVYILNSYNSDDIALQLSAVSVFFDVLSHIIPKLKKQAKQPIDKRIEKAMEYINVHSRQTIKVSDLAAISNMSVSNFYACFKKQTSLSPIEYKNQIIIKQAIHLLNEKNIMSVEEISDMLGFESPSYFYRVFKRITGKTPVEYRKNNLYL